MDQKARKLAHFDPIFPIKVKNNVPTSMVHISGTGHYFATQFAALKPQRKVLSFKINLLFDPGPPIALIPSRRR